MAITFKHVNENESNVNTQKKVVENKEKKPTTPPKKTKKHFSLSDQTYEHVYWILAKINAIFSLVLAIAAAVCTMVFYWYTPNHMVENTLKIMKILKMVFLGCGFVSAGLFLAESIITTLNRSLEGRMYVFNWMLFLFTIGLSLLVAFTPNKATITRNIQNCLTGMTFMTLVFIMSFASMWGYSHGPEDCGFIDLAGLNPVCFMFIFLAVISLFQCIVAFSMNSSPTIQEGENLYFKLWSMSEAMLIASGCIVFGLVFTVMEEGSDFVVKTVFAGIMVALCIISCVFVLLADQSTMYSKHILIGVFSVLGSAGSIAMTPVMFKSMI